VLAQRRRNLSWSFRSGMGDLMNIEVSVQADKTRTLRLSPLEFSVLQVEFEFALALAFAVEGVRGVCGNGLLPNRVAAVPSERSLGGKISAGGAFGRTKLSSGARNCQTWDRDSGWGGGASGSGARA